jgi:hypothetical protein
VKSSKRKEVKRGQEIAETNNAVEINNRFNPLTIEETSNQKQETTNTKLSRPPPIYVYGVINYPNMISQIRELEDEQCNTKSLINNTVKINCTTPDSYRKLVKILQTRKHSSSRLNCAQFNDLLRRRYRRLSRSTCLSLSLLNSSRNFCDVLVAPSKSQLV